MRAATAVLLAVLAFAGPGCKRARPPQPAAAAAEEPGQDLAATIHVADPKSSEQLISGFHQIENKAWRWTAKDFVVVLRPPAGAGQLGGILQVNLTVPPVVIEKSAKITLTPSIGGTALPAATYDKPGEYVYQGEVPGSLLTARAVKVEFALDHAIPANATDQRELGLIVSRIGLKLK